jgi:hypothetical protein
MTFSKSLLDERLTARIQVMTLRQAARIFNLGRIPAIYLLENRRVVREWTSDAQAAIALRRNDIREAIAEIADSKGSQ